MKSLLTALTVAAVLALGAAPAMADDGSVLGDPCCAAKECIDDDGDGTCDNPNGGKACDIVAPGAGAGCVPGAPSPAATCAGGDATVPAGCICIGGQCTTDFLGGDCTSDAVDACCAAGACH